MKKGPRKQEHENLLCNQLHGSELAAQKRRDTDKGLQMQTQVVVDVEIQIQMRLTNSLLC